MPTPANIGLAPSSGNPYVRRIEVVCDMHRIPFGSPSHLAGFLLALNENKHLAMDFWSLVARMSDAGSAPGPSATGEPTYSGLASHISDGLTLNGRLLETIVEGVTGQRVADVIAAGSDQRRSVGDLASLLAGEDIHAPVVASIVAPTAVAPTAVAPTAVAPTPPTEDAEARPVFRTFADAVAGTIAGEIASAPVPPVAEVVEVEQTGAAPATELAPTVRVSVPVKETVGVIEPLASFLPHAAAKSIAPVPPVVGAKASEPVPPSAEAKSVAPTLRPEDVNLASPVLTASDAKSVAATLPAAEAEPDAHVPVSPTEAAVPAHPPVEVSTVSALQARTAAVSPQVEVVTGPIAEKPAINEKASASAGKISSVDKSSDVVKTPIAADEGRVQVRTPEAGRRLVLKPEPSVEELEFARNQDAQSVRVPLQGYAESNPKRGTLTPALVFAVVLAIAGGGFYVAQQRGIDPWQWVAATMEEMRRDSGKPVESSPSPTVPPESADSEDVPAAKPQESTSRNVAAKHPVTAPAESTRRATDRFDPTTTPAGAGGAVEVSRAVMDANRITSRPPIYPEAARRARVQGRVVLQAIVLKDGSVGHLHVVAGDPILRSAAMQAVARWRYWPYLVNGEPVDVSTLIAVNFSLNQASPNQPE